MSKPGDRDFVDWRPEGRHLTAETTGRDIGHRADAVIFDDPAGATRTTRHPLTFVLIVLVCLTTTIAVSSVFVAHNTSRSVCVQRAAAHAQVDIAAGAAVISANGTVDNATWKQAVETDQARIDAC